MRLIVPLALALVLAGCATESTDPPTTTSPASTSPATTSPSSTTPPTTTTPASTPTTTPPSDDSPRVEVSGFRFVPADLTVVAGTTVRFRNEDAAAHTATADDGAFHLALDGSGDEGEITLDTPGTYAYHCALHASMRGSITVN